jgi:signal transduction histidine kinase
MSDYIGGIPSPGALSDRESSLAPAMVLVALGLALEAVVLWNLVQELETLRVAVPPLVAAGLGTTLAAGICYAGYRQVAADLPTRTGWGMTGGAALGGTTFLLVFAVTIAVRLLEGRSIPEPQFALYTAAGAGALAGILVGYFYSQARLDAREAQRARNETEAVLEEVRRTRDRIELVNSILRHDIANDIMVIRARAGAIVDRAGEELADHAETILEQVDGIEDQLERTRGILDAVTAESDRSLAPVSLSEALRGEADAVRTAHPEAAVSLDVPDDVRVRADDLLPDVVGNVISNAVTHSDRDSPQVDISVEAGEAEVVCRIADNGPGIPDELKRAVLEEGYSEQPTESMASASSSSVR